MALNNIDSQFAVARTEVRALIKHCKPDTQLGGQSIDILQSIVDTLDAIQNDSYDHPTSFDRHPQNSADKMRQTDRLCFEGSPMLTKPDFNLSAGLDKKACKL